MTYKANILVFTCFMTVFCDAKNVGVKSPIKRSNIAIPNFMDKFLAGRNNKNFLRSPVDRMFTAEASEPTPQLLDFIKRFKYHSLAPERKSRKAMEIRHYTAANVEANICQDESNTDCKLRVSGKFGRHSPHKTVQGRLLHILDEDRESHYGCSGEIANVQNNSEPWIAFISRGKCSFSRKIKLAEKYNASAVIIYNTNNNNDVVVMQTVGTKIPSLMINSSSGQKMADISRRPSPVFMKISVGFINIVTSMSTPAEIPIRTEATIHFLSKQKGSLPKSVNIISSVIASHSPTKSVFGKLVHIRDFDSDDTHFGCEGRISNENELSVLDAPWVALVARGKCPDLAKVKLAENYKASAVIVYNRNIDEELKASNVIRQQGGYTKYPCFICYWDRRATDQHWIKNEWPIRGQLVHRDKNIVNEPLVSRYRIILPPLHIKLDLMRQFTKALEKDGACFDCLCKVFPGRPISIENKAGIFDGQQIRKLTKDHDFPTHLTEVEKAAWHSFVAVVKGFLGNTKASNYVDLVEVMLTNFRALGPRMSIKVHYLFNHLDRFPDNFGNVSEEQRERFHQDIKSMEERYQGRWDTHMMEDYCGCLMRSCPKQYYNRKSSKRTFLQMTSK